MTAKHTPGPWFSSWIGEDGDRFLHISSPIAQGTGGICDLPMFQYGDLPPSYIDKQREANARLIAAAPELLDVLKGLCAAISWVSTPGGWVSCPLCYKGYGFDPPEHCTNPACIGHKADKAITKAEGH